MMKTKMMSIIFQEIIKIWVIKNGENNDKRFYRKSYERVL